MHSRTSVGSSLLDTVEIETAPKPDGAVIWLHGLGADGHDFEPVVPELVRRRERAWRFVFPHAPEQPVSINGGMVMRAWYDIPMERGTAEDRPGFLRTDAAVRALIAREAERGIPASRVVLAGFSQGGAVTLYSGLRYEERLAGLMALSTYLPLKASLASEAATANAGQRIFMAHGLSDGVVPIGMGLASRQALLALGYVVEWHQYPMAHAVCPPELADIREFLFRVLG